MSHLRVFARVRGRAPRSSTCATLLQQPDWHAQSGSQRSRARALRARRQPVPSIRPGDQQNCGTPLRTQHPTVPCRVVHGARRSDPSKWLGVGGSASASIALATPTSVVARRREVVQGLRGERSGGSAGTKSAPTGLVAEGGFSLFDPADALGRARSAGRVPRPSGCRPAPRGRSRALESHPRAVLAREARNLLHQAHPPFGLS